MSVCRRSDIYYLAGSVIHGRLSLGFLVILEPLGRSFGRWLTVEDVGGVCVGGFQRLRASAFLALPPSRPPCKDQLGFTPGRGFALEFRTRRALCSGLCVHGEKGIPPVDSGE